MDTKRSSISIGADMEVATVVVGGPLAAVATVAVGRTIETGSIGVAAQPVIIDLDGQRSITTIESSNVGKVVGCFEDNNRISRR